ncbi:3'(2'),5'-bisphosphate nucleotidase CysQ [Weeksellaceae bacterium KMM 9724]|uniref:3'(2'),5'-bisphosphate nucleotidase CysQ n=1 Tax=Profundicola chukchiensis TaxID=2961959 RepID=UPI002438C280|nr:3'(2'),5'-bisphosphate nucleotidase CysQ [Profundicola chukchiensis]MDG4949900.1 3'(2'),5'-bisphosphate nucleotidase CysQ [Profundicola chukchiensis]
MKDTTSLLRLAQEAAIEAGREILKIYDTDFEVDYKEDQSPLTQADQKSNQVIMSYLNTLDIPIISEENQQLPYAERKDWKQFWLVDPLDGTKEFIKKNGEFTVNIALISDGIPVLGVIYVPVKKELFFGSEEAAFKMLNVESKADLDKVDKIQLQAKQPTSEVVVVASRSHLTLETEAFIDKIKNTEGVSSIETISAGSSLKICMVAEAKADVYPRYAPTMEWDVAAGHAICHAAGVKVLQAGTDQELIYNKENLLNPWFVVGNRFFN